MKLKILTISALLASSFASYAMDKKVKIQRADVLKKRLTEIGMDNFYEQTDIIDQLADQEKSPQDVAQILETSLSNFQQKACRYLGTGLHLLQAIELRRHGRHIILNTFLKDFPEALQELEKDGLYNPEALKELEKSDSLYRPFSK